MSTSPSWFDQDKFSRLVKKVGTTTRAGAAAPATAPVTPAVTSPIVTPITARKTATVAAKPATPPADPATPLTPSAPAESLLGGPAASPESKTEPAVKPEPAPAPATPPETSPAKILAPAKIEAAPTSTLTLPKPSISSPIFSYKSPATEAKKPAPAIPESTPVPVVTPEPEKKPESAASTSTLPILDESEAADAEEAPYEPIVAEDDPVEEPKAKDESTEEKKTDFGFTVPKLDPPPEKPKFEFKVPESEMPRKSGPPTIPSKITESTGSEATIKVLPDLAISEIKEAPKTATPPPLPLKAGATESTPLPTGKVPPNISTTTSTLQRLPRITPGPKPPALPGKPISPPASVSTLARRSGSLPGVQSVFDSETSGKSADEEPIRSLESAIASLPGKEAQSASLPRFPGMSKASDASAENDPVEALAKITAFNETLAKVASLKEELARVTEERDHAQGENQLLREQLREADDAAGKEHENLATQVDELTDAARERDEARLEIVVLKSQLQAAEESAKSAEGMVPTEQLTHMTAERDTSRRDYGDLRQQFEKLKQDQMKLKKSSSAEAADLKKQLEEARKQAEEARKQVEDEKKVADDLRKKVDEHADEISNVKGSTSGMGDVIETLKQELKALHDQLEKAKDEASTAQRGLALSQKALQETRDALKLAGEGKEGLENLKKERTTLVQQNMLLQAQNDQIARELSAAKSKIASKS